MHVCIPWDTDSDNEIQPLKIQNCVADEDECLTGMAACGGKQHVKTPKGITTAFAPTGSRVRIPVRKTARTSMNVRTKRTKHALGTPSVETPLGALPVCVRKDLNAIAIRDALTLMNVKFGLTRYFLTCHITDIHSN